jgi:soluble lytic murein transglycosylase
VLALLLGLGTLIYISRPQLVRAAREIERTADMHVVERQAPMLRAVARETGLDPNLLAAIMLAESSGRVDAVSSAGALGLFQLMLPTARERAARLGLREPSRESLLSDAQLNARLAADYVGWLSTHYDGDVEQILIAYNAGPARLDGWIREAGSYARWRAERERAGDSQVLAYANKVARYRQRFAERGVIAPVFDQPPAPNASASHAPAPAALATEVAAEPVLYGPPAPAQSNVAPPVAPANPQRP